MKILVTGGNGYIGNKLIPQLLKKKYFVYSLDKNWFGDFLPKHKNLKKIKGDVKDIKKLISVVWELRDKCPWDRKQTFETLKTLTIEETFELCEEIENLNYSGIKEELGDLLLHILFYAKIGSEKNKFNIGLIAKELTKKLIRRHPNIYKDVKIKNMLLTERFQV